MIIYKTTFYNLICFSKLPNRIWGDPTLRPSTHIYIHTQTHTYTHTHTHSLTSSLVGISNENVNTYTVTPKGSVHQNISSCLFARFYVFATSKIQVEVFWVMTPCSVVVGHQNFGGLGCFHLFILYLFIHSFICHLLLFIYLFIYLFTFRLWLLSVKCNWDSVT
jgi:hypothetical protein